MSRTSNAWIESKFLPHFSLEEKEHLATWISEKYPYLDDDVELRDKLANLLHSELNLEGDPEPYNTICRFLKTRIKGKV